MICRLCGSPLHDDRFTSTPAKDRPIEAHRRCALAFMRDVAFVQWIADDTVTADRWQALCHELIGLDPAAYAEHLLDEIGRH